MGQSSFAWGPWVGAAKRRGTDSLQVSGFLVLEFRIQGLGFRGLGV